MTGYIEGALACTGLLTICVLLAQLITFIWRHFLSPSATLAEHRGRWAVVTGASSGIGSALARALAKRGINVALIARSRDKLDNVSAACIASGVDTRVLPFDLSTTDQSAWHSIIDETTALAPSILVNSAGINAEFPTMFLDMSSDDVARMHSVNISAADKLTRALLPAMRAAKRGLVLFLSSAAGVMAPSPLLAPYAGTKAYVDAFALALAGELIQDGVIVHSVAPFFVESPMAKMRKSFTVPSADQFANQTLDSVGGQPRLCPHWPHALMAAALTILPLNMQITYVANLHKGIRKRALRKQARLAADQKAKTG